MIEFEVLEKELKERFAAIETQQEKLHLKIEEQQEELSNLGRQGRKIRILLEKVENLWSLDLEDRAAAMKQLQFVIELEGINALIG